MRTIIFINSLLRIAYKIKPNLFFGSAALRAALPKKDYRLINLQSLGLRVVVLMM